MSERNPAEETNDEKLNVCDYCGHEVEFGKTEHGFKGFIHIETGTTKCPA